MSQYSNNVSFQAPTDFNMEQQAVERQRKLAEAMMMRGQQQQPAGAMVSGHYVPQSWTQGLAQALQGPAGMYAARKADEQSKDIATRQRKAYADELTKFGELANGTPIVPESQGNNPSAFTPEQAAQPGDRRAALAMALGAQNPALQKYGMDNLMPKAPEWALGERFNQQTGQPEKFMYDKNNPASQQAIGGQKAVNGTAVNGQLVNPATGQTIGAAIPKQLAPDSVVAMGPGGTLVPNAPVIDAKSKIASAGKTNVNNTISVAGPENAYNKDVGEGMAKANLALVEAAKGAPEAIRNARSIRTALDNGAITGTGAQTRLAVQKALETAGVIGSGKAATTQELMSNLGKLTLSGVKTSGLGAGNGFTDKDLAFLSSATSGTIEDTPANLRRVADLSERLATAQHRKGTEVVSRWRQDPSLKNITRDTVIDPIPGAAGAGPAPRNPLFDEADAIIRGGK